MENLEVKKDRSFQVSYLNGSALGKLKAYYEDYKTDCQKYGFVLCSFSAFIVDMAIDGYLYSKERRKNEK